MVENFGWNWHQEIRWKGKCVRNRTTREGIVLDNCFHYVLGNIYASNPDDFTKFSHGRGSASS